MRFLGGILTFVFMGGAAVFFLGLLYVLCDINMFTPFDRESWREETAITIIKSAVLLLVFLFVLAFAAAAFMGFSPLGDTPDASQWEPAW